MDFNWLVDVTWIRHIYHKLEEISEEVEDIMEEVETVREYSLASMFELDMDFELNDINWLNYIYQKIEDLATDVENIIREVRIQALNHGNRVYSDIQELIHEVRGNLSGDHDSYEHDDDVSIDDEDDDEEDELIQEVHANLSSHHEGVEDDDDVNTNDDDDHEFNTDDVDDEDEDDDEVSTNNNDDNDDVSTDDDDDSGNIYDEDDSSDSDDEDDRDDADESSNDYEDDDNDGSNDDEDDGSNGHNSRDTVGLSEGNLNVRNEYSTQQLNLALSEGEDLVGEREYPYGNIGVELEQDSTAIIEENDISPQIFDDLTPRDIEQLDASTTDETFHSCDSYSWGIVSDISYESENLIDDEFEKTWELIDDKEVHSIPRQLQGGSTKERILNLFGKKKMLAKEYEELATLFKDVDKEDDQAASETSLQAKHPN